MQKHEQFEELCALAVIGQMSPGEYAELSAHMRSCDSCYRAAHEFVDVVHHLPLETSPLADQEMIELQEASRAQHFLSRAQTEGVVFSREALKIAKPRQRFWHSLTAPVLKISPALAVAVIVVFAGTLLLLGPHHQQMVGTQPSTARTVRPAPVQPVVASGPADGTLAGELSSAKEQIASIQQQLEAVNAQRDVDQKDRDAARLALRQADDTVAQLHDKIAQEEKSLSQATAESQESKSERDKLVASLVADESRLRDLEAELKTAHASIEQERQLNAAVHDVRELMGARNLHIIDVYDSDNRSRSQGSFGRVIYTEGKSLIFYAFDLDKAHGVRKVSFQAWGEREGDHKNPKKLGVFYVDDAAQKRWVMKVNDPDQLRAIDTVFVTVESHHDADSPSGQRLLQAFLSAKPNHP